MIDLTHVAVVISNVLRCLVVVACLLVNGAFDRWVVATDEDIDDDIGRIVDELKTLVDSGAHVDAPCSAAIH